jgi:hypothetical protein
MKISIFALAASLALGFMSEEVCEVVLATLKGSSDAVRINKDDFDADQKKPEGERQYGEYKGKDEPEQSVVAGNAAQLQTVPSADSRLVMKDGGKFFVVDGMGAKLTGEAVGGEIDEEGYKSEKAAQDAIAKLPR